MNASFPQPWLDDALAQLDLRRDDRTLMLGCPSAAHLQAVIRTVGRDAPITIVEPDLDDAEVHSRAAHEPLQVLAGTPSGDARFGSFDAVLACPLTTMGWPLELWPELLAGNLRPGGRFVLDLPDTVLCEPLVRAWEAAGGATTELALLSGPPEHAIAEALRQRGLRGVEGSVGTHVLGLPSPFELAALAAAVATDATVRSADLERCLIEALRTTGDVEVIFHRTRIHGQR